MNESISVKMRNAITRYRSSLKRGLGENANSCRHGKVSVSPKRFVRMFETLHRSPINVLTIVKRPKMSNGISEVHESPQIGFLTRSEEFSRNATLQCLIKIYARRKRFRACIVQDSGKDMLGKAVAEHYCRDKIAVDE